MALLEGQIAADPINPVLPLSALVKKVLTSTMSMLIPLLFAATLPRPLTDRAATHISPSRATAVAHVRIIEMTQIAFVGKEAPPRARRSRAGLIEFQ
jgi:hypothetical protein